MRSWLLETAGIDTAFIEQLMDTLDEEEVDTLTDLRMFVGLASGRFDALLTVTTAGKIRDAFRQTTPPMSRRGTPSTPTPTPTSAPASANQPDGDIRLAESADDAAQDETTQALPSPPPAPRPPLPPQALAPPPPPPTTAEDGAIGLIELPSDLLRLVARLVSCHAGLRSLGSCCSAARALLRTSGWIEAQFEQRFAAQLWRAPVWAEHPLWLANPNPTPTPNPNPTPNPDLNPTKPYHYP